MKFACRLVIFSFFAVVLFSFLCGCANFYPTSQPTSSSQEWHAAYERNLARRREEEAQHRAELCSRIAEELPQYSPEYVKRAVGILGICQKALETPQFLVGTVHAEASSEFDKLELDFPAMKSSAAHRGLFSLVYDLGMLSSLDADDFNSNVGINIGYRMSDDISAMRAVLIK